MVGRIGTRFSSYSISQELLLAFVCVSSVLYLVDKPVSSLVPIPFFVVTAIGAIVFFIGPGWPQAILIASSVVIVNSRFYVQNLGDRSWLTLVKNPDTELFASSLGGHAILRLVATSQSAIQYVPPFLGGLTSFVIMFFILKDVAGRESQRTLFLVAFISGCLPIFSRGFVEVTPYGLPVAFASVMISGALAEHSVSRTRQNLAIVFALVASLLHGVFLLLVLCLLINRLIDQVRRRNLKQFFDSISIVILTAALTFFLIALADIQISVGDASGGGDGRILPTSIFALGHILQSASLFVIGSTFLIYTFVQVGQVDLNQRLVGLMIFGSFLMFWNFDLGWQRDLDLVLAASLVTICKNQWRRTPTVTPMSSRYGIIPGLVFIANMIVLSQTDWIVG
jgi:hypothetical protein